MSRDLEWIRVEPNDPNRCQATHKEFQCPYKAIEGSKFCPRHAGYGVTNSEKASARKYMVAQWEQRIRDKADNPKIKDLSEEIGVLSMLLERTLDSCKDENMLLMSGGKITTLIDKITIAVEKWHKIQMQTNVVMDKTQAIDFIHAISDIIYQELDKLPDSAEILKRISAKMVAELESRTNYGLRR